MLTGGAEARDSVRETLRETHGPADLLLTDSGTTALTLALRAVTRGASDRPVALPAYCCYDVATAAAGADVPVVLYDVDPRTLGPEMDSLRDVVREGVAAVVVAHLYGIPVDLGAVLELAEEAGVPVIEDAAQGAGGRFRGRPLGSFGSLSVLSFGRGKGTTGCGGGALLAHDARSVDRLREAAEALPEREPRGLGRVPVLVGQWIFGRPGLYAVPSALPFLRLGETVYREPEAAGRISALSAGTLRTTLGLGERELALRRTNARRWREATGLDGACRAVDPPTGSQPGHLRFPVLATAPRADRLRGDAARSIGVMPGYPRTLDRLATMEERCRNTSGARAGADTLARRLFTLPTHSRLRERDVREILSLLGTRCAAGSAGRDEDEEATTVAMGRP